MKECLKRQKNGDVKDVNLKELETVMYLSPNEPEFRAYELLLQISRKIEIVEFVQRIPKDILHSPEIQHVLGIIKATQTNNFVRLFHFIETSNYFVASALYYFARDLRESALDALMSGFKTESNIPL